MSEEVIGRITPDPVRRTMAAGFNAALGLLLLYSAASHPPPAPLFTALLVVVGAAALAMATWVWRATAPTLELTRAELRESGGRVLCRVADIASVDRGSFAFKPAGGFAIRLTAHYSTVYAPGLWWRTGRRLMVGGATSGSESKAVAELIRLILAERTGARETP